MPKKIASRREALWLTAQIGVFALLSTLVVVTLLLKITGKDIPDIYGFAVAVPLIVAPPIAYWLANLIYEITRLRDEIERIAYVDALTGIANRRGFFEKANHFVAQLNDRDESVSVILIDIDHFKNINDTWGHRAGDAMLVVVADILTRSIRETDGIVGRIGGEEFALLVVHGERSDVMALADTIRQNIKSATIDARNTRITATVSVGLAHHRVGDDLENTLLYADKALYLAKNAGRDRVVKLGSET